MDVLAKSFEPAKRLNQLLREISRMGSGEPDSFNPFDPVDLTEEIRKIDLAG